MTLDEISSAMILSGLTLTVVFGAGYVIERLYDKY